MVGDDLIFGMEPGIKQLMEVAATENMAVVGVLEVPRDKVSNYGIINGEEFAPGMYRVRDLVEKPRRDLAPSRMAMVGRYVLLPEVFEHLEKLQPEPGGEIELTDALRALAKDNRLLAVKLRGRRFDAGDWVDFLTANIYFAMQDEDLRYDLVASLRELLPSGK
jgi:UTP--glucose-1-phosphate uridylyltransferase